MLSLSNKTEDLPGVLGTMQGNMTIYFKGTRDIFGINMREQGISLLLKGTLTKKCREQMEFINREQEKKSEVFKRSREHATPWEANHKEHRQPAAGLFKARLS